MKKHRRTPARAVLVGLTLVLGILLQTEAVFAQEQTPTAAPWYRVDVHSFSGSPLLLEIHLRDTQGLFSRMEVEAAGALLTYELPPRLPAGGDPEVPEPLVVPVAPFFEPGVYELTVRLFGREGSVEIPYRIGFTDFVWGRDNFRFGNNGDFETLHGDYSLALFAWLEERFGEVPEADKALLVHYMYGLFGRNPGRCYAFSGTQYRFLEWPELLPSYNDSVYDVRGGVERIRREMHYLQMDIVFERFVEGGTLRYGAQSLESARREVEQTLRRIGLGDPVVAGFIGPELHHSMLIYGYIDRLNDDSVDLLVANNWKDGQDSNVHNKNAEYVRVNLNEEGDEALLDWQSEDGARPRRPNRFFLVDVQKMYQHDRVVLDAHIAGIRRQMESEGLSLLVVENAASAWLTDGEGNAAGYEKWREVEEIEGVSFQRRKRAYTFEIGTDRELQLHVEDNAGVRIYFRDCVDRYATESWTVTTEAPAEEIEYLINLNDGEITPAALEVPGE